MCMLLYEFSRTLHYNDYLLLLLKVLTRLDVQWLARHLPRLSRACQPVWARAASTLPPFQYQEMLPKEKADSVKWAKVSGMYKQGVQYVNFGVVQLPQNNMLWKRKYFQFTFFNGVCDHVRHRCLSVLGDYVSTLDVKGKRILQVEREALVMLTERAYTDIAHLLRPAHLQVWRGRGRGREG